MGDISEQIVHGECCALCTMPFKQDHGYPVACNECWDKGCGYQKAIFSRIDNNLNFVKTITGRLNSTNGTNGPQLPRTAITSQNKLNGLIKFINKKLNIIKKGDGTWGLVLADYMNQLIPENEIPPQEPEEAAVIIQQDFSKFVKWFRLNKETYKN